MQWNVLIPEEIDNSGITYLNDAAEFTTYAAYGSTEELYAGVDKYDAIILRSPLEITEELISKAHNLKVVSKHGVGLDSVDIPAASHHGIIVCNTPGANSRAVAEHTIGLIIAARRNIVQADRSVRDGEWKKSAFEAEELRNNVLGLYGCGNIGERVGAIAHGLGMKVRAYDPYVDEYRLPAGIKMVNSKESLFQSSDVLSIHVPLTDETRHSVSKRELQMLGDSGIVVNTSRGGVIDESSLLTELRDGKIAGAALDVLDDKPPSRDHPLFDYDNVIVTPHIGGATIESDAEKSLRAAKNVETVRQGNIPESTVNVQELVTAQVDIRAL